jgi:uncharacterized protein with ParB-like and HNH nuclease domain
MKSLQQFKSNFLQIKAESSSIRISSLIRHTNIDLDVFLPTRNKYLQREYVWNNHQQSTFIESILIGRFIPSISVVCMTNEYLQDVYQIIDGRQRVETILKFVKNEISIILDGNKIYFNDLPKEYQNEILFYTFKMNIIYDSKVVVTDDLKISWFKFLNFAGTQVELEHINNL